MKRNVWMVMIVTMICCFSLAFISGCAKSPVVKEEALISSQNGTSTSSTTENAASAEQEAALREAALKEQAQKEKILAEAAAFQDIYFEYDKYNLQPEARTVLEKLSDWLLVNNKFNVTIEGHCDERGTAEYNLALGERRAEAAKDYLINLGVDKTKLSTISYGEEMPVDSGHNEEAWLKNRRAHFAIIPIN